MSETQMPPAPAPWPRTSPRTSPRWAAPGFAAVAGVAMAFAFVGLSRSGFWVDELFSLYLVDHHGGWSEVVRRSLTDIHPPAYQLLLYAWTRVAGLSEPLTRLPSVVAAVTAVGVFALAARRVFSGAATAFAAAIGATSAFWMHQAQNVRSYALCMLLSAVMVALAISIRTGDRDRPGGFPSAAWAALSVAGALASFTHFYAFLATGWIMLALIVSVRSWRTRGAVAASGGAILAAVLAYMTALLSHTRQDVHHMWFHREPRHLVDLLVGALRDTVSGPEQVGVALLLALAAAGLWRRGRARTPPEGSAPGAEGLRRWAAGLGASVMLGVWATGALASYVVAPSMSLRNLLVAAPALWLLLAALYDAAMPALGPRGRAATAALLLLLAVAHLGAQRERLVSTTEPWRGSAAYVRALPACVGQPLPAVEPLHFGPDTPFFRALEQRYLYGHYLGDRWTTVQVRPAAAFADARDDPALATVLARRVSTPGACPVLAWAVHDIDLASARRLAQGIAAMTGAAPGRVRLRLFFSTSVDLLRTRRKPTGFVVEAAGRSA